MAQVIKRVKVSFLGKLNIALIVIAAAIMFLCYFDTQKRVEDSLTTKIEPYTIAKLEDGSKDYFFDLRDYDYHYSGLMFYTAHQIVHAYTGGREIYAFDQDGGIWTSSVGSTYNFVEINERIPQIAVIVKPCYDIVDDQVPTFYIGSAYGMYDEIMAGSMPRFFVSILTVILSILIFIYYGFMHRKQQLSPDLIHLAYFSFFCGVWSLNETNVSALVFSNKIVDSLIPYMCLMLIVPPFIMFFDSYLDINSKISRRIIIGYSMAQAVVLSVLHFLKIAEYRETILALQLTLILAITYMVGGMIVQLVRRHFTRKVEICAVGLTLFLAAILVDIAQYYSTLGDADRLGRYVFIVFIFMLSWDMIKDANEIIEKGRRAKQLEIFALTDSMTGLLNRNAFEKHAKSEEKLDGVVAVVADANGLKKCNDTFGHEAGDEYITTVADIFNSVYGKYGNCYRTGGDEFCCIIPSARDLSVERLKKLFLAKIYTANIEGGHAFNIGVAIGSARYDAEIDGDFRSLVKRADAHMYENKKQYKESEAQIS